MRTIEHSFGSETFASELIAAPGSPSPTVILFPTIAGISKLEIGFAERLAEAGYNGLCADLYGEQFRGCDRKTGGEQMKRLQADRSGLRERLLAVVEAARGLPESDGRIAAIGFCFGGQCALDLARSGANVAGVASFHGLFDPPRLPQAPIGAKVIAFHGWDDPMVPPDKVVALGRELSEADCDWQIHAFGGTVHGFTNRDADKLGSPAVRYSDVATRRSWRMLADFLTELFDR
ncbi:MAG: dienelactone hydrolase family protein [Sphingomicrobium sp.]